MILYIDETETDEYFIVAGLLADSEDSINAAYKSFRKSLSNYPISNHHKEKIFLEFKSTLIDRQFQKIKIKMLQTIQAMNGSVIYSCYVKKHQNMKQFLKESVYITLLSNIINDIDCSIHVVFDRFNKADFENSIINTFKDFENVLSITAKDSQAVAGLQFVDNICSTIRLHLTHQDVNKYFSIIEKLVQSV